MFIENDKLTSEKPPGWHGYSVENAPLTLTSSVAYARLPVGRARQKML